MFKVLSLAVTSLAFGGLFLENAARADVLDSAKAKGVLVVGSKTDYKPFGYREADGSTVGLSVQLAKKLGDALGVKVELVSTTAANQIEFLSQGRIDILIAAMNATPERRKVVDIIDPGYAASGATLLAAKAAKISRWEDISGKRICAIQGAFYNRPTQEKYNPQIVAFKTTSEAYTALKGGNCVALVYDDNSISQAIQSPDWEAFEAPVSSIFEQPTVMAVAQGNGKMRDEVHRLLVEWYKDGSIADLEKKWLGRNSDYVLEQTKTIKQSR